MHYVYLIRSIKYPKKTYVGNTENLLQRLETHNSGGSVHTMEHRPWELVMFLGFADKSKAIAFERYLKSQSGRAFAKKRFWWEELEPVRRSRRWRWAKKRFW